jgi:excisionase family DNA binding protein
MENPFSIILDQIKDIQIKLSDLTNHSPPNTIEIITQDELCKRLMISKPTLIRWVKKKNIPFIRIGKSMRFNWHKVIEALEFQKK